MSKTLRFSPDQDNFFNGSYRIRRRVLARPRRGMGSYILPVTVHEPDYFATELPKGDDPVQESIRDRVLTLLQETGEQLVAIVEEPEF